MIFLVPGFWANMVGLIINQSDNKNYIYNLLIVLIQYISVLYTNFRSSPRIKTTFGEDVRSVGLLHGR